ncbi:penicillin acylase family protein [Mangrovivirga sp. M17]|uniref:Penicillin acylase family protein n=1 Tax=Mangrovivirga halotolerans TaxID=2993936 RepID=A0ABT3RNH1_9BACT|nr:penicillin acylase family protein [Mangrovivirga halotolerans]MCX2743351.1 penicillin acylase family protein [Mangrovivirga halotolerans]
MNKTPLALLICLLILGCKENNTSSEYNPDEMAKQVVIYRDIYGIPHVYGETDESTMFGYAYARAEDDFKRLEKVFIEKTGRKSEFEITNDLSDDYVIHAFEIPEIAKIQYESMSPKLKKICDAYVAGLNYYLKKHPEQERKGLEIEPWMILTTQKGWWTWMLKQQSNWKDVIGTNPPPHIRNEGKHGSNSWAIDGSKTKSGNPMLLVSPHMTSNSFGYEVHLKSKEGLNFYGFASLGSDFFPVDGFNENLGWSQTTNWPDIVDTYQMVFDHPSDSLKYKFGNQYRKAKSWIKEIKVKYDSGIHPVSLTFLKTIHGPVLKDSSGNYFSYKIPDLIEGNLVEQFYKMCKASDFKEWKKALSGLDIPYENFTYADKSGNIFYVYNGKIPIKDKNQKWDTIVDGTDSDLVWEGYLSLEELPQILNPEDGFLQNCNSSPFSTTFHSNPDSLDFPSYLVLPSFLFSHRAERSKQLLSNASNVTLDDFQRMVMDTYLHQAEVYLPELFSQMDSIKKANPPLHEKLSKPIKELRDWDKYSNKESAATTLFTLMMDTQFRNSQLRGENPALIESLEEVVSTLETHYSGWEVPWKNVLRHQRSSDNNYQVDSTKASYPTNGNQGYYGSIFRMDGPYMDSMTFPRRVIYGNAYVMIVEFTKEGPVARSIMNYGESSNPDSPHFTDQAEMFANGELKPVWFILEEIENNLETRYHPGEEE